MDPLTHSATGLFLGRAGLNRYSRQAPWILVLAANAPDIDIGCVGRQNQNPGGLSRVAVQTRAAQEQAGSRMCKRIHAVRRPDCSTEKKAGQARRPVPACPWSSTFASNASWRAGFSE